MKIPQNIKSRITIRFSHSTSGCLLKTNENTTLKRYMHLMFTEIVFIIDKMWKQLKCLWRDEKYVVCAKSPQSCPTLCNPMKYSQPGSSVHGILQARILEWVAIPSSRGSSLPKDRTHVSYVSCVGRQVLYHQHHLVSPNTQYKCKLNIIELDNTASEVRTKLRPRLGPRARHPGM